MAIFNLAEFTQEDLGLYFRSTVMRLIFPTGVAKWAEYHGKGDGGHEWTLGGLRRRTWLRLDAPELTKYSVDIIFPFGYFNTKKSVVFCERMGARQNLKGLQCRGNFHITPIESRFADIMGIDAGVSRGLALSAAVNAMRPQLTPDLATQLFEQPYYPLIADAATQIRSRKVFARALSAHFALVPHHEHKDFTLFFHNVPAAEYYSKAHKMKILAASFRPEVLKLCAAEGVAVHD